MSRLESSSFAPSGYESGDRRRLGAAVRRAAKSHHGPRGGEGRGVSLIEISAVHTNPATAKNIANAVAHNYVEESLQESQRETRVAIEFFSKGADESLQKLRAVEDALDRFGQKNAGARARGQDAHATAGETPTLRKQVGRYFQFSVV